MFQSRRQEPPQVTPQVDEEKGVGESLFSKAALNCLASNNTEFDTSEIYANDTAFNLLSVEDLVTKWKTPSMLFMNNMVEPYAKVDIPAKVLCQLVTQREELPWLKYKLKFEKHKTKPILLLVSQKRSTSGKPFANIIFLCISLQTYVTYLESHETTLRVLVNSLGKTLLKIENCVFSTVINQLQRVFSTLFGIVTVFLKSVQQTIQTCSAEKLILCLQNLQEKETLIEMFSIICKIFKECETLLQTDCSGGIMYNKKISDTFYNKLLGISSYLIRSEREMPSLTELLTLLQPILPKQLPTQQTFPGATHRKGVLFNEDSSSSDPNLFNAYEFYNILPPIRGPNWEKHYMVFPARICIIGPTGSGKTNAVFNIIKAVCGNDDNPFTYFKKVIIFTGSTIEEPLYKKWIHDFPSIKTVESGKNQTVPPLQERDATESPTPKLIIFDDFIHLGRSKLGRLQIQAITQYSIASRKYGWTCIFIGQKFAGEGIPLIIRAQCQYFLVLKKTLAESDLTDLFNLSGVIDKVKFKDCLEKATKKELGFLTIDTIPHNPAYRLRIGLTKSCCC